MRTTKQNRYSVRGLFGPAALALTLAAVTTASVKAADITLNESGSTLLYPLFKIWVENYTQGHPGVSITTDPAGSEAGIKKAIAREAQIGASDVFMSDRETRENPQIVTGLTTRGPA